MKFLSENLGTILVAAVLLIVIVLIVIKLVRDRKRGKCSCGCENCPSRGECGKKR